MRGISVTVALALFLLALPSIAEECDAPYSLSTVDVGNSQGVVLVSDFDNDGTPDLVVFTWGTQTDMFFFKGNGDGTFKKSPDQLTGMAGGSRSGAVADFNNDGLQDIVVTSPGWATVIMNRGGGKFVVGGYLFLASSRFWPTSVVSTAIADLNGDGQPDVILTGSNGTVGVFLGKPDGSFRTLSTRMVGDRSADVSTGDLDGDGRIDVVIGNAQSRDLSFFLGNGDGTFGPLQLATAGIYPNSATLVDIDRDGDLDMLVPNLYASTVSVLLNEPTRPVPFVESSAFASYSRTDVYVLQVTAWNFDQRRGGRVAVLTMAGLAFFQESGDAHFTLQHTVELSDIENGRMASGDFDGDGDLDFAVISTSSYAMRIVRACTPAAKRRAASPAH